MSASAHGPDASQAPTPYFQAIEDARYQRQSLIREYEDTFGVTLIVYRDLILPDAITPFQDALYDADTEQDLHLMLASPGGDGETAVRLLRAAQAHCRELVVIVPDAAKSAATLIALGAHSIVMGTTSDLGPIDPQLVTEDGRLVPGKDIIAAVDRALSGVQEAPETYPIYATLLGGVTALMAERARAAMERSDDLLLAALQGNPDRAEATAEELAERLREPLIKGAQSHAALFGLREAKDADLPVIESKDIPDKWDRLWRLWTRYVALDVFIHEGHRASHVVTRSSPA